jgi:methyl-accepting chemotaxis protein
MDQVTQQNSAIVEQFTAASCSLTEQAAELVTLVSQFSTEAKERPHMKERRSVA